MAGKHKYPMIGWRPPADLSAWARSEAARRGTDLSEILTEALSEYRDRRETASHDDQPEEEL